MRPPSPADYGITEEDVSRHSDVESRTRKTVFGLVYTVLWVGIAVKLVAIFLSNGWTVNLLEVLFGGFFAGSVIAYLVASVLQPIVWEARQTLSPKIRGNAKFREARIQYEHQIKLGRIEYWRGLEPYDFEREVAALLRRTGHTALLTGGSGDEGVDIIVDGGRAIVQCKRHARPVGPAVVRELLGARVQHHAAQAILVALSGFTAGAHALAKDQRLRLWDVDTLVAMQRRLLDDDSLQGTEREVGDEGEQGAVAEKRVVRDEDEQWWSVVQEEREARDERWDR